MNVYIIYRWTSDAEWEVDEVYLDKNKAIQKVIETKLRGNDYYNFYSQNELKDAAERYIETVVVSE